VVSSLRSAGIDASRGSTQIAPVRPSEARVAREGGEESSRGGGGRAREGGIEGGDRGGTGVVCPTVMALADGVVFLPVSYRVPDRHLRRMARCVVELLRQEEEAEERLG